MVQCEKQLMDMGFIEVTKDLFMKDMGKGVRIFRDYRDGNKRSYAYRYKEPLSAKIFKELKAIEKIEEHMASNVLAYC